MNIYNGIRVLCSESPTVEAENRVFLECHLLAKAYLCTKNKVYLSRIAQLSNEDMALDLIAELFRRDQNGRFTEFRSYFLPQFEQQAPIYEIEINLRRLVFTEINDRWFALFKEWDPVLSRFVRMIKHHFKKDERFGVQTQGKKQFFYLNSRSEEQKQKRLWSQEELRIGLGFAGSGLMPVWKLPDILYSMLKEESALEKQLFSITDLALAYREHLDFYHEIEGYNVEITENTDDYESETFQKLLTSYEKVKHDVNHFLTKSYVKTGKLSDETALAYLSIVDRVLYSSYFSNSVEKISLIEAFKLYFPKLTHSDYKENHRAVIEYVFKVWKETFVKKVKIDLDFRQMERV